MYGRRVVFATALALLIVLSALAVVVPRAAAQPGPVGPKTITVDGDPSDWTGVVPGNNTGIQDAGEYIWNDTAGDDTGDGDYTYPLAADLNVTGLFDLTEVRITADAGNLYFLVKVGNLNNPWGGPDGFSTVSGIILIDTTRDAIGQTSARPNVRVAAGSGWEYWARIGQPGWHAETKKVFDAAGNWAPIENKGSVANDAIEVSIPLAFIGKDGYSINNATWRFMLLWQSHDGFGPNGFRDVVASKYVVEWSFGGGADHGNDPQVQDLAFSASAAAQAAELGSYSATSQATVASYADITFGDVGFVPDSVAPTLSGISASPTFNQVTIAWNTDEIASTAVDYGRFLPPALERSVDEFVTSHSVTISGLRSASTYYYQVESVDIANNAATSAILSFTTAAAPPTNLASFVGSTFVWQDATGDDTGDGNYVYPNEPTVSWAGRADIWFLNLTLEGNWVHTSVRVNAQPETIWRQRMASFVMFIDVDRVPGSGATSVGFVQPESPPGHPLNISVAPAFAWEYMVLGTFQNLSEFTPSDNRGELLIRDSTFNTTLNTYNLVYMSTLNQTTTPRNPRPNAANVYASNGGTQLDFWLNVTDLGLSTNMTYIGIGALYDDAGGGWPNGGIRQVRPSAGNWEGGGSNGPLNPNAYDLAFYGATEAQQTDLSQYGAAFTTITTAMQIDLSTLWNARLSALGMSATLSDADLQSGETSQVTVTLSEGGAPVAGASVRLAANPAAAVDILPPNPTTTDTFGSADFVVRARTASADTSVVLTATGTVEGFSLTSTLSLQVRGLSHTYQVFLAAGTMSLGTGEQTSVTTTFTDKGLPVSGASVTLASSSPLLTVTGSPATTNAQGVATFTVRAGYSEADVTAQITATATNGTAQTIATAMMTVEAFVHVYTLSGSASPVVVAANATTTLTFVFRDAGAARAAATVVISMSPTTGFDPVGDVSKTTDASGQVTFTLRARSLTTDTSVVVTATASNGTATNVASATVTVVAQAVPEAPPVTPAGVTYEVFIAVAVVLAAIAAAFAVMWARSRKPRPPEQPPEEGAGVE